jgi:hypothetical protein
VQHPLRDGGGAGWRLNLCHIRATGPIPWLMEHVAGIIPMEPGYRVIDIVPNLGDLAWVEASLPTAHGLITVRHERRMDGMVYSSCTTPSSITRAE